MEAQKTTLTKIDSVQIDSLAAMKIVEHIEADRHSGNGILGHGCLVGLADTENRRLEITNCFPRQTPIQNEEGGKSDIEEELERGDIINMLQKYRKMSIDYELVGFYESFPYGAAFNRNVIEDMIMYQEQYEYNVVLIYDPVQTCQGQLALKAYRLSDQALKLLYNDMSPAACKAEGLTFSNLCEEIPIVVKSSHLISVMIAELQLMNVDKPVRNKYDMQIAPTASLAKCVRGLMTQVDTLNKCTQEYNRYTLNKQKAEQQLELLRQRREVENDQRKENGEPLLSMADLHMSIKWPVLGETAMLPSLLAAADVQANAQHAGEVSRTNLAKLQLLESLLDEKNVKLRSGSSVNAN